MIRRCLAWSGAAAAMLLAGCTVMSFAPIAVPNSTATMPSTLNVPKVSEAEVRAELEVLQKAVPEEYKLQPGDSFAIIVDGQAELSRPEVTIMPNGMVSVAPIGYLRLAGLTVPQASDLLRQKYNDYLRDSTVVIEPQKVHPYTFTISGSVQSPGVYPFVFGNCRLMDAIVTAKGFTSTSLSTTGERYELADLANAYIVRNGKVLPVDFEKAVQGGDSLNNIPILPGDYIHIPSLEGGMITLLGEIGISRCIPYQPRMTLLQAIAHAGGLRETNSREVKVIRGGLKNPVVYNIDIRDRRHGRVQDFPLRPRDIVFVPRDNITEWNIIIKEIVPTVQLLNGLAGPFGNPGSFLYR